MTTQTFANIRVLDLTRLLPGAVCTLMLADQGADVIKIEQPQVGDYARWYVPRVGQYAALFHAINRNKRSVVIDLKQAAGQAALRRLVQSSDVLIESFRPKVARRLGLTYDILKDVNPALIVCNLSGYGQDGPMADVAGHDLNFAGQFGITAAGNEQVLPIQAMDFGGAYLAAFAISAALLRRGRTGEGGPSDVALMDAGISLMTIARAESFARHAPPRPAGELLTGGFACYRVYRTADDKPFVLAALEPKFWKTFCTLAGREDLAGTDFLQPDEQPELIAAMTQVFASKTEAAWIALLAGHETCASPVQDVMQAAEDEQLQARDALYMADGVAHTRTPFRAGPPVVHQTAPDLGAHTDDVLREAGYTDEELASLRDRNVIG